MEAKKVINTVKDLEVYRIAYSLALEIFIMASVFPKSETYSLKDQILRSSRSVAANISEGYAMKNFENIFKRHLIIAMGSLEETKTWLDFAKDFNYINGEKHSQIMNKYSKLGRMIYCLYKKWKTIKPN